MRAESALHEAETALGSIDMHEAAKAHIFVCTVVHARMIVEWLEEMVVPLIDECYLDWR